MAARKVRSLCCIAGRYRRTIGRWRNSTGRVTPKKFLLGTDSNAAEIANVRLEQLWRDIERYQRATLQPGEALWNELTLAFAEAIRLGQRIRLPIETSSHESPLGPTERVWWIRATYPGVADLLDEKDDEGILSRSRVAAAAQAEAAADLAHEFARIACRPAAAAPPGQTLHRAIEAWGIAYRDRFLQGGNGAPTETGRKGYDAAQRLKECHPDIPLHDLSFAVVDEMAAYWCRRPTARTSAGAASGSPISVATVKNMLGFLRQFLVWLHRSDAFGWRDTDRIIDDATRRRRVRALLTPEERKREAAGPATWTLDELVMLYRYATNGERLLLLLGLNGGFAQSEVVHRMREEVHIEDDPPQIRYIRHKSAKPGGFALWPQTVTALQWNDAERRRLRVRESPWAVVSAAGHPLTRQRISNRWNALLARISARNPAFPKRPFKVLRKTAAELIQGPGATSSASWFCRSWCSRARSEARRSCRSTSASAWWFSAHCCRHVAVSSARRARSSATVASSRSRRHRSRSAVARATDSAAALHRPPITWISCSSPAAASSACRTRRTRPLMLAQAASASVACAASRWYSTSCFWARTWRWRASTSS